MVDEEAKEIIDTLPYVPPKVKAEKLGVTLCNVDAKALVVTLTLTLPDEKVDTKAHTR